VCVKFSKLGSGRSNQEEMPNWTKAEGSDGHPEVLPRFIVLLPAEKSNPCLTVRLVPIFAWLSRPQSDA
jgi:hypothetical protein